MLLSSHYIHHYNTLLIYQYTFLTYPINPSYQHTLSTTDPAGWSREQTAAWIVKMIHSKYDTEGKVITQEDENNDSKENSNSDSIVQALQPANMTHAGLYLCQMTGKKTCFDVLFDALY